MTQVTEGKRREGMDEREPPTFGVQRADPGPRAACGRLDLLGGRGRVHGLVTSGRPRRSLEHSWLGTHC